MDSVKVKNFIILVLLIVNAILLSVFVSDTLRERAQRSGAVEGAVQLLAENGISVAEDVDLSEREIETLSLARDTEHEERMVTNVLGNAAVSDQGGNILLYFGSRGEAGFRGTGGVEMNLHSGEYSARGDLTGCARGFARSLGLRTVSEPVSLNLDEDSDEGTLELCCSYDGVRVINCVLSFTFADGELLGVYGTRVLDTVTGERQQELIDVPTVLTRFLSLVLENGHVCSSLDELELCYNMQANAAGEATLTPVWRIETDTGEFFINAVTGLQETVT